MSYDAELERLLEVSQSKERVLAEQVTKLRAKNLRLREERRGMFNNIGELNSMIAALELEKASLQGLVNDLTGESRNLRTALKNADGQVDGWRKAHQAALRQACGLQDQVEELQGRLEDEPDLALAACKKKLQELEGMLEAQRRNTRELGVNLQNTRDVLAGTREDLRVMTVERDQWQKRAQVAEEKIAETRAHPETKVPVGRLLQVLRERDDYLKQLQDLQRQVNRAKTILDPVKGVSGVESTFTAPVPRDLHQCAGINGSHRCQIHYLPGGSPRHPVDHQCHCGFLWPW